MGWAREGWGGIAGEGWGAGVTGGIWGDRWGEGLMRGTGDHGCAAAGLGRHRARWVRRGRDGEVQGTMGVH